MDATLTNLTFGVELEFIATYNPEDYEDALGAANGKIWSRDFGSVHQKYGTLVRLRMIKILNDNGFPTNDYEDEDFSKWTVDTDGTVADFNRTNSYAIELKTPVLKYSSAALNQVASVVELLVSKFKLYTNESCGLHVHVGIEERGFTLSTLKTFCSLITVFENQLESLHPPDRRQNTYAKSTRMAFRSNASPREKLSIIDRLEDKDDLIRQFSLSDDGFSKYWAFNFSNLQDGDNFLHTIEFRQHRGTLDPRLITNWAMVACNLVHRSRSCACSRRLVEEHIHNTGYTVIDLFKNLNLSSLAEFYALFVDSQYETNQNSAVTEKDKEGNAIDKPIPERYYTLWEQQFAPRPPPELRPYAYANPNYRTPAGSGEVGNMESNLTDYQEGLDSEKDESFW